ncbi:Glucoamylase (glucan-1,4-alpha-glucosidase), GH15 family [Klenkia brasiliensis]|uniref:Trehalase n=1 Tax=Klenkia brasiliensis TaxID=333142 RepID=A0A1G7T2F1_9ACTN|nr:Glucoamylase (glucan-1,4-alpha-glucosidase), GH15 family [Klenkia brasiliensis]
MTAIEDLAVIGDLQTAALVDAEGSLRWLCLPRFDSPACFASLLDSDAAGHWRIAPAGGGRCTRRRYRGDTLVLETEWETDGGTVRVVDLMPLRGRYPDVVRVVEGVTGEVAVRGELAVRFDYGRVVPWVRRRGDRWQALAGPDALWLSTPAPLEGRDRTTVSEFTVRAGDRVPFVLTWTPGHHDAPPEVDPERALGETVAGWERWVADGQRAGGRWADSVTRSLITLRALTHAPTGGIVAAVTTSLPEQPGGPRNWDYRYSWLRDSTYTLQALLAAGHTDEAGAWRRWLLRAVAGDPADLQIMYAVDGTRRLPEAELDWLAGWEGSRPVRTGNAAAAQLQLDVVGEVLDGLHLARAAGLGAPEEAWDLQCALLDHLEGQWRQPDSGLWEQRGEPRHFVHSKVMAWVAFDRMVRGAREHDLPGPVEHWAQVRDAIRDDVLEHGVHDGHLVQSYGSTELDAALLLVPRVGFLPADDPRVVATVEAVQRELTRDGLVLRYRPDTSGDGLPGTEGVFLACSFWLVDALHGIGRRDEAEALFERLLGCASDLGLLSEEWDPDAGRQLGNTPQAFSHFALVVSAVQLEEGRHARSDHPVGAARAGAPRLP